MVPCLSYGLISCFLLQPPNEYRKFLAEVTLLTKASMRRRAWGRRHSKTHKDLRKLQIFILLSRELKTANCSLARHG